MFSPNQEKELFALNDLCDFYLLGSLNLSYCSSHL